MSNIMAVLINGIAQLEYDRDKALTDYQLTYLDEMDKKMEEGINIDGENIEAPELNQKIQFVTANMLSAIKSDKGALSGAAINNLIITTSVFFSWVYQSIYFISNSRLWSDLYTTP